MQTPSYGRTGDAAGANYGRVVGDGLVIFYKRLEGGTFELPQAREPQSGESSAGIEMRWSDLSLLLEGIELSSVKRRKRWRGELHSV